MAKGAIHVEVDANTSKAAKKIQGLKKQAEQATGSGSIDGATFSRGHSIFSKLGDSMGEMGKAASSAVPELSSLGGTLAKVAAFANPLTATGAAVATAAAVMVKGFKDLNAEGMKAMATSEKLGTTLGVLAANFGTPKEGIGAVTRELQLMAANGVNSIDSLAEAQKTLTVAFDGNVNKAAALVKSFDDLAAGTGVQIDDWASMASEVMKTGVSIKDLTRLSNRGIPIYQAFAKVMGTTAEEAEALAKAGKISTEDWLAGVQELAKNYKGLSAQLSSNTLEGAQATYQASKELRGQAMAEGSSDVQKEWLNKQSAEMQAQLNDPVQQEALRRAGKVEGYWENLLNLVGDLPSKIAVSAAKISLSDEEEKQLVQDAWNKQIGELDKKMNGAGAGTAEELAASIEGKSYEELQQLRESIQEVHDAAKKYARDYELLSSEEFDEYDVAHRNFEEMRESTDAYLGVLDGAIAAQRENAEAMDRERKAREEEAARLERGRVATLKYGTRSEKLSMLSGRDGIPIILDEKEMASAIEQVKKKLMSGDVTDVKATEQALSALETLQREYAHEQEKAAQEAARAEEKLTEAREKAAEAARKAESEITQEYIKTKAGTAKAVTDAQKEYQTITEKLEELQADRELQLAEESRGIYRDKWKGLNVASYDRQESKLLAEQKKAAQKLDETKQALESFDKNWETARNGMTRWLNNCLVGNVVKVKGTALAG